MVQAVAELATPVDPTRDHIRDPAEAPVTLVAYADYQCRYCHKFRAIVYDLQAHLGERLRVVFRHFSNAKLSVIAASLMAGSLGWLVLARVTAPATQTTGAAPATAT